MQGTRIYIPVNFPILPRNRDSGALQKWLLPGVDTPDLIQHLPTRKLAKNVYQLEMQPSYAVECASVYPIPSKALSFLASCEKAAGIPADEIALNAQDVLAYIRAVVLREKEPSDAAAYALRACGFWSEKPHEENDLRPSVQAVVQKMPLKELRGSDESLFDAAWNGNLDKQCRKPFGYRSSDNGTGYCVQRRCDGISVGSWGRERNSL